MRADLHAHTTASRDAVTTPRGLIRAARRAGLDAVAVTDHDSIAAWDEVGYWGRREGVLVIPGVERRVTVAGRSAGDLVCLFLRAMVVSRDAAEVVREVRDQGGLVAAAHPFRGRKPFRRLEEVTRLAVAIEVLNGRTYGAAGNRRAADEARRLGLAVSAGSDAHTPFEVGAARVVAAAPDLEGLKCALAAGEVFVEGRVSHPLFSLCSYFGRWGLRVG